MGRTLLRSSLHAYPTCWKSERVWEKVGMYGTVGGEGALDVLDYGPLIGSVTREKECGTESLESSVLDRGANHVVVDAPNPKLGSWAR
jgi:hypothetical protein